MCSRDVTRTLKLKLHSFTQHKRNLLSREHKTFNKQIHSNKTHNLYSANRQQANRLNNINKNTQHPLVLRNDLIRIEKTNETKLSNYWTKIPVYNPDKNKGESIWCPIKVPDKYATLALKSPSDSKLVREEEAWYLHLTVQTSHDVAVEYTDVLGVDLGAHHLATTVLLSNRSTTFYGENIRRIREHYKQLKKSVGKAKITSGAKWVNENCSDKESKRVEHELHRIANSIVSEAVESDAVIVVGDLEEIRKDNDKGRFVNDKVHSMPFAKFVNILEYKAYLEGVEVVVVGEVYTSQTCNWCGEQSNTSRTGQGLFECGSCGLEDNADKNGALNIAKRGLGKDICQGLRSVSDFPLSDSGVDVTQPGTRVVLASESDQDEPVNSPLTVEQASSSTRSPRL